MESNASIKVKKIKIKVQSVCNTSEKDRDSNPVKTAVMYFIKDPGSHSTMLLLQQLLNINQSPQTDLFYPQSLHCAVPTGLLSNMRTPSSLCPSEIQI